MSKTKSLLFRFHRGGLDDSLKTVVEVDSLESLISIISKDWEEWILEPLELDIIKIDPYVYDHRINWDTHIVTVRFKNLEKDSFMPVGFLNRKPDWYDELKVGE